MYKMNNHRFSWVKSALLKCKNAFIPKVILVKDEKKENCNVESIKIIGLPVIVSVRHRIVLDKNIRTLYGIQRADTVTMQITHGVLFITPYKETDSISGEKKVLSIGRFNLPQAWAKENCIDVGDFVYLVATSNGIVVCPKNLEMICIGGLN